MFTCSHNTTLSRDYRVAQLSSQEVSLNSLSYNAAVLQGDRLLLKYHFSLPHNDERLKATNSL